MQTVEEMTGLNRLYMTGQITAKWAESQGLEITPMRRLMHDYNRELNRITRELRELRTRSIRATVRDCECLTDRYQDALEYGWEIREKEELIDYLKATIHVLAKVGLEPNKEHTYEIFSNWGDSRCRYYNGNVDCLFDDLCDDLGGNDWGGEYYITDFVVDGVSLYVL